jgi:nucleoside-diphosphate-sugar epimerase
MEKVVIVTGVSSGLGKAFATALLHAGFKVVGTVRKQDAVREFEELRPGSAFARVLDVTDAPEQLAVAVEEIEQNIGPVYALINNAGYGHEGTLEESPMDELRQQFEVNVFGAVAMMKAVLPFMRARREGRILNVTSMGGLMTMPGLSYYHGSKFALEGISSSLAKEIRPPGDLCDRSRTRHVSDRLGWAFHGAFGAQDTRLRCDLRSYSRGSQIQKRQAAGRSCQGWEGNRHISDFLGAASASLAWIGCPRLCAKGIGGASR